GGGDRQRGVFVGGVGVVLGDGGVVDRADGHEDEGDVGIDRPVVHLERETRRAVVVQGRGVGEGPGRGVELDRPLGRRGHDRGGGGTGSRGGGGRGRGARPAGNRWGAFLQRSRPAGGPPRGGRSLE